MNQNDLRIQSCNSVVAVAEQGPVCITLWRGAVTSEPFELQRAGLASVAERYPGGVAFLCVVEASARAPDDALRRASSQMVQAHRGKLRCVACVVEGNGFKAATNRGVLSGMALLLDKERFSQIGVFATVDQAAPWMAKHIKLAPTVSLPYSVGQLRIAIGRNSDDGAPRASAI